MSILDQIILEKQNEVAEKKAQEPLKSFIQEILPAEHLFIQSIKNPNISLIAEHKVITDVEKAKKYIDTYKNRAQAVSMTSDMSFLITLMKKELEIQNIPVLYQDIIVDEYQIYEARRLGADAMTLSTKVLDQFKFENYVDLANALAMDVVIEVTDEDDVKKALDCSTKIISINNRNPETLEVDLGTTIELANKIPGDRLILSTNGIKTNTDIFKLLGSIDAVFVNMDGKEHLDLDKHIEDLFCGIPSNV